MKQSAIDEEITGIANEINVLEQIKDRLIAVRDRDAVASAIGDEPKVRKTRRKRNAGLPSAAPPASDANHAKGGERL